MSHAVQAPSPSSQPPLMAMLAQAAREPHARLQALPFFRDLERGLLPPEAYLDQLRAMAVVHATLEHERRQGEVPELEAVLGDRPSRLMHLREDLVLVDHPLAPGNRTAMAHALEIAAQVRRCRVGRSTDLLGLAYVLEGSTLGHAVHLPDVLRSFGARTQGLAAGC